MIFQPRFSVNSHTVHAVDMKLKNRVALITRGSSGIGRASAVAMARKETKIALTARRSEHCREALTEIESIRWRSTRPGWRHRRCYACRCMNRHHCRALGAPRHRSSQRRDQGRLRPYRGQHSGGMGTRPIHSNVRGTCLTVKYTIPIPREFPQGMISLQQRSASSTEVTNAILLLTSDEVSDITGSEIYDDETISLFQG